MKTEIEWIKPSPENLIDDLDILICHGDNHITVGYCDTFRNRFWQKTSLLTEIHDVKYIANLPRTPLSTELV